MHYRCVFIILKACVLVGLDWAEPMMFLLLHVTCWCIFHVYVPSILSILILLSLSLSLSLPLLLSLSILLLLTFGSVMRKPIRTSRRTFHNAAFIWNVKSSSQIFLILTFPLSSTIEVESHCMAFQSLVLPWSYRSFTSICTNSTILYLILSLAFDVHAS